MLQHHLPLAVLVGPVAKSTNLHRQERPLADRQMPLCRLALTTKEKDPSAVRLRHDRDARDPHARARLRPSRMSVRRPSTMVVIGRFRPCALMSAASEESSSPLIIEKCLRPDAPHAVSFVQVEINCGICTHRIPTRRVTFSGSVSGLPTGNLFVQHWISVNVRRSEHRRAPSQLGRVILPGMVRPLRSARRWCSSRPETRSPPRGCPSVARWPAPVAEVPRAPSFEVCADALLETPIPASTSLSRPLSSHPRVQFWMPIVPACMRTV